MIDILKTKSVFIVIQAIDNQADLVLSVIASRIFFSFAMIVITRKLTIPFSQVLVRHQPI